MSRKRNKRYSQTTTQIRNKRDPGGNFLQWIKTMTGPKCMFIMALIGIVYYFFVSVNQQYISLLIAQKIDPIEAFKNYGFLPSPSGWNAYVLIDSGVQLVKQLLNAVLWAINAGSPAFIPDIPYMDLPENAKYSLVTNFGWFIGAIIGTLVILGFEAFLARDYADSVLNTLAEKRAIAETYNQEKRMSADPDAIEMAKYKVRAVNYHELDGVMTAAIAASVGTLLETINYFLIVPKTTDDWILFPGMDGAHWVEFFQVIFGFEVCVILATLCYSRVVEINRIKRKLEQINQQQNVA